MATCLTHFQWNCVKQCCILAPSPLQPTVCWDAICGACQDQCYRTDRHFAMDYDDKYTQLEICLKACETGSKFKPECHLLTVASCFVLYISSHAWRWCVQYCVPMLMCTVFVSCLLDWYLYLSILWLFCIVQCFQPQADFFIIWIHVQFSYSLRKYQVL